MDKVYCNDCNTYKSISEFHKNKNRSNGLNGFCKECMKLRIKKSERTKVGVIRHIFAAQKRSSAKRRMKNPSYTLSELIDYCATNAKFDKLYDEWVESGYNTLKKPSFDRKKYSLGYSFENIELMTWGENYSRQMGRDGNKRVKRGAISVANLDKKGKIINIYKSANQASLAIGKSNSGDILASITRNGTAGGFRWKIIEK